MEKIYFTTSYDFDYNVDFDNMAKRQGIAELTRGFGVKYDQYTLISDYE